MNTFANLTADLDRLLARYTNAKTENDIERRDETLDGIINDGMLAYEANRLSGVKGFEERQASFRTLIESLHADGRVKFADPHGVATGRLSSPVSVSLAQEARQAFAYLATLAGHTEVPGLALVKPEIEYADAEKVKALLEISASTLDRRVAEGTIGAFKMGELKAGRADRRQRRFVLINGKPATAEAAEPHVPDGSTWVTPSVNKARASVNKALSPSQTS